MRASHLISVLSVIALTACPGPGPSGTDGGEDPSHSDGGTNHEAGSAAPTLDPIAPVTLAEGQAQTVALSATDKDGDPLAFSLIDAPAWATVSGAELSLSPGFDAAGEHSFTVRVTDGAHPVDGAVQVTVTNVNRPPTLAPIADLTLEGGASTTLAVEVTDPDGDPVTITLPGAPPFVAVADHTVILSPPTTAIGSYGISVVASDGSLADSTSFKLTVSKKNHPPMLVTLGQVDAADAPVPAGALVALAPDLSVSAVDPDGDPLTLEIELVPSADSFTQTPSHTAPVSGAAPQRIAPGMLAAGDYKWQVRAKDAGGAASNWYAFNNGSTAFTVSSGPIVGWIKIHGGQEAINFATVGLLLDATSSAGAIVQMRFSNDGATWTAFEPWATNKQNYALSEPTQDGVKTVWVEVQDEAGNTARMSDTVLVDRTPPSPPIIDYRNGRHVSNINPVVFSVSTTEPITPGLQLAYAVSDGFSVPSANFSQKIPFAPTLSVNGSWGPRKYLYAWLRDAAGNYSSGVRYEMELDGQAPKVFAADPWDGQTGVWPESTARVTFSEPIDPLTFNASTVTVSGATGRWELDGVTGATFVPQSPMTTGAQVTLTFDGLQDLAGNALAAPVSFSFTVGATPSRVISPALPKGAVPVQAQNATGTMLLFADASGASDLNPNPAEMRWAFWNGSAWSGGSLGKGSRPEEGAERIVRLVPWGDKFVASWPVGAGRRWAIFDQGAWTWPTAPAPRGDIAANALGVMQVYESSVTYYDPGFNTNVTDKVLLAELYDGLTWGPAQLVHQRLYYSFEPRIAASDTDFAVLMGTYNSGTYYTTLTRYGDAAHPWTDSKSISAGSNPGLLVSNATGFAFASSSGGYPVVFDGTQWKQGTVPNVRQLATDGQGFAAAGANGSVEIFENGAWTAPVAMSGAPEQLVGQAGRYLVVHRDATNHTAQARVYENGGWSSPWTGPAASGEVALEIGGAAIAGSLAVVTLAVDGDARALVRDAGNWSTSPALQTTVASGAMTAVSTGSSMSVLFGDGRHQVARRWNNGAFDAPQTLSTSTFDTMSRLPKVAFLPSGEGLAVWEQVDLGVAKIFAAQFDGAAWQPAVRLADLPGKAPAVAQNGTRFVVLFKSHAPWAAQTKEHGVYAVAVTPGSAPDAPVELIAPATNTDYTLAPALASDGSGFFAIYGSKVGTANPLEYVYRTSADGLTWSPPATLETGVSDLFFEPQVVGNSLGYLIAAETSSSQWSRRIYAGGTLGPSAAVSASQVLIAANPTSFAWVTYQSQIGASFYSSGSWSTPATITGYSPKVLAGNGTGYLLGFSNKATEWNGTSWTAPQYVGADELVDAVADGTGYAGAVVTGSTHGRVAPAVAQGGPMAAQPDLGGPEGTWHPVVGVSQGTRHLVWEQTDPAQGVTRINFASF